MESASEESSPSWGIIRGITNISERRREKSAEGRHRLPAKATEVRPRPSDDNETRKVNLFQKVQIEPTKAEELQVVQLNRHRCRAPRCRKII